MKSDVLPASVERARHASPGRVFGRAWPHVRDFLVHALGQKRVLGKAYPGIMHALLFWGVTVQVLGTIINMMQMQLFIPLVELSILQGRTYLLYEMVMDLAGIAILAGVLMAAIRRIILRPATLESKWDDYYALILLALIPIAGFSLEAMRLLALAPEWANWSPVGNAIAELFQIAGMSPETAASIHPILFWVHVVLGVALVGSIPFTKLRHLIITPLNVILRNSRPAGTLSLIEDFEEAETFGVGQISEFSSQQLLSFDACVRCGRCEEICPAAYSGMPYSPRSFVQSLRQEMVSSLLFPNGQATQELMENSTSQDVPWYCSTCGACLMQCPAFVNPVDAVIDLRRYQTLTKGQPPQSVVAVLRNLERQGNPWGMPGADRTSWAKGLGVRELKPGEKTDVLLFLGCAFAYDDRNKQVTQAFVRLLQKAEVDFAILGLDEGCCGETARRLGEEYLFQMLAQQNLETLAQVQFNRIVTQCPHCFNTLKNEYRQLGGEYDIQHYTSYLDELGPRLKLESQKPSETNGRLTYHDPCYLGRYNQIYEPPRDLLALTKRDKVEMARYGENSFCCGGGGGQMWMESDAETRINHHRLADVLDVDAEVVATACPYCLLMLDDAIRSKDLAERVQVLDIAELLVQQLEGESNSGNGRL